MELPGMVGIGVIYVVKFVIFESMQQLLYTGIHRRH